MPSYRSVAANVAQHKENHPELYCPVRRCLWRTGDGSNCPRHKSLVEVRDEGARLTTWA
jgi:hypothetical protein